MLLEVVVLPPVLVTPVEPPVWTFTFPPVPVVTTGLGALEEQAASSAPPAKANVRGRLLFTRHSVPAIERESTRM